MRTILILLAALFALAAPAAAQQAATIVAENSALIEKASRQTIGPVIDALAASGDPAAATILLA
jgi:urea transport system permease protein